MSNLINLTIWAALGRGGVLVRSEIDRHPVRRGLVSVRLDVDRWTES